MVEATKKVLHGIEYSEADIVQFPGGIPGFESLKGFLLTMDQAHEPFVWLYSVQNPQIRFLMVNPVLLRPDYDPKVVREHIADLNIEHRDDLLMFCIVTLNPNPRLSTVNLLGPVFINIKRKLGKQVILDDPRYSVREKLMPEGA